MSYYVAPQTYTSNTNLVYSNAQSYSSGYNNNWGNNWDNDRGNNWNDNWYGHSQRYYPGWKAYSHHWNSHNNHYKTAYFDRDFKHHYGDRDGYNW
jgi:hypothetical protein